jgi:hypothetical protein
MLRRPPSVVRVRFLFTRLIFFVCVKNLIFFVYVKFDIFCVRENFIF